MMEKENKKNIEQLFEKMGIKKKELAIIAVSAVLIVSLIAGILVFDNRSEQNDNYETAITESVIIDPEESNSDESDSSVPASDEAKVTEEDIPEFEHLRAINGEAGLIEFLLKTSYFDYDATDAVKSYLLGNLTCDLNKRFVNWDLYPVESEEVFLGGNNSTTKDPLEKINNDSNGNGGWFGAIRMNADAVNWVAKNIFNATDEDIKEMVENAESDTSEYAKGFYLKDGHYYSEVFPGGGPGNRYLDIISHTKEGQMHIVEYIDQPSNNNSRYALMAKKRIGGIVYWTMYYNGEKRPADITKYGEPSLRFSDGETYTVVANEGIVVRNGPGKQYDQISYDDLSEEEKLQASEDKMAIIKKGGKVKCKKMEGDWMEIEYGQWICAYYEGEELVK